MPNIGKPLPSREYLLSRLSYDPETGILTWRYQADKPQNFNTRWAGKAALNCTHTQGYRRGNIDGNHAFAHRVIFKMMTGEDPEQIDHDDGDRANNRWGNLLAATPLLNSHNVAMKSNNVSGRTGVFMEQSGKWIAQIRRHNIGKTCHLGSFERFEDACAVREAAEREIGFRARARA